MFELLRRLIKPKRVLNFRVTRELRLGDGTHHLVVSGREGNSSYVLARIERPGKPVREGVISASAGSGVREVRAEVISIRQKT